MANWINKKATASFSTVREAVSGDNKIYVLDDNGSEQQVWEYEPVGNTETLILDTTDVGFVGTNILSIAWFNGDLYFLIWDNGGIDLRVDRWDGVAGETTTVHYLYQSLSSGGEPASRGKLYATSNVMVATGINQYTSIVTVASIASWIASTSNGELWVDGSIDSDGLGGPGIVGSGTLAKGTYWPTGVVYDTMCAQGTSSACFVKYFYKFNQGTGNLDIYNDTPIGNRNLAQVSPNGDILWTSSQFIYTDEQFETTGSIDFDTSQAMLWNMPYSVGFRDRPASEGCDLYILEDNLTWTLLEQVDAGGHDPSFDNTAWVIRLANGNVYIVGTNNNTATVQVWERDEPLLSGAMFYQGTNTLTLRSTSPVNGLSNPDCMAVRDSGAVFLGSDEAGEVMVAKATPADTWANWADITETLDQTRAVKALKTV